MMQQYGLARKNRIISIEQSYKMSYSISTLPGHSGSPLLAEGNIIGIHNGRGVKSENYNVGRAITFRAIDNLEIWQE
jgi:V8-like Glu-specific endopeptidase